MGVARHPTIFHQGTRLADVENHCSRLLQSETYTPVYSEAVAQEYSINYNPAVHGKNGPVQVSYPKYFYPQSSEHTL